MGETGEDSEANSEYQHVRQVVRGVRGSAARFLGPKTEGVTLLYRKERRSFNFIHQEGTVRRAWRLGGSVCNLATRAELEMHRTYCTN